MGVEGKGDSDLLALKNREVAQLQGEIEGDVISTVESKQGVRNVQMF